MVQDAFASLPEVEGRNLPTELARRLDPLLRNLVAIEPLFGSCSVYLPPSLSIDLKRACGESGYIHSCGGLVYFRNGRKAEYSELEEELNSYLNSDNKGRHVNQADTKISRPVRLLVYSHEDFSAYDRDKAPDLKHGLEDLKIHLDKTFLRSARLTDVLKKLQEAFPEMLEVPEPGDYRRTSDQSYVSERGWEEARSLFLVSDRGIGQSLLRRNDERYLILYAQDCVNENPFHIMDENKPAWYAHTTIPHTMMGAMINIGLGQLDTHLSSAALAKDGTKLSSHPSTAAPVAVCTDSKDADRHDTRSCITVADPFCGTGTTAFELAKFPHIHGVYSDKSEEARAAFRDNAAFFSMNADELETLIINARLRDVSGSTDVSQIEEWNDIKNRTFLDSGLQQPSPTADDRSPKGSWSATPPEGREIVPSSASSPESRLRYYICLRVWKRHAGAFARTSIPSERDEVFSTYLREEVGVLLQQMEELKRLRAAALSRSPMSVGSLDLFTGRFSLAVTHNISRIAALRDSDNNYALCDALMLPEDQFEMVVCDPPYGFNTDEDAYKLSSFYIELMKVLVRSLRKGGVLVLCLPDRSFVGRDFSAFARPTSVDRMLYAAADAEGRRLFTRMRRLPQPVGAFTGPYYWRSEKALQRTVLVYTLF